MRKIVFFDADGTLCHMVRGMSDETKAAVRDLAAAGVHVVLCTGRSGPLVGGTLKSLPFSGWVTSGGSCIRCGNRKEEKLLPPELVSEVLERTEGTAAVPILLGEELCMYDPQRLTEQTDPWLPYSASVLPYFREIRVYDGTQPVNKICLKTCRPEEEQEILDQLADHCLIDAGNNPEKPGTLEAEIFPDGVSKGQAVMRYLELLEEETGENRESWETWAVGDGGNDIAMFRAVKHSAAMGDASDRVKAAAEFVTGKFAENGAAQVCRRILQAEGGP